MQKDSMEALYQNQNPLVQDYYYYYYYLFKIVIIIIVYGYYRLDYRD